MCKITSTGQVKVHRVVDIEYLEDMRSVINQLEQAAKFGEPGDYVSLDIVNGSRIITLRHRVPQVTGLSAAISSETGDMPTLARVLN
jgi:hypothetical protein